MVIFSHGDASALLPLLCYYLPLLRPELKQYLPQQDTVNTSAQVEEIHSFFLGQLAVMETTGPGQAKVQFVGERRLFRFHYT